MIGRVLQIALCIVHIMRKQTMDIDTMESIVDEMESLLHMLRHY